MIKKINIFFTIAAIAVALTPEFAHTRGGWGAFGGALVGTAVVGSAVAASQDRAARDYHYSRMADREMQARNYEQQIANQRLLDENERQRRTIQDLSERMNAIENKTTNNRRMSQRPEQQEMEHEEYSY